MERAPHMMHKKDYIIREQNFYFKLKIICLHLQRGVSVLKMIKSHSIHPYPRNCVSIKILKRDLFILLPQLFVLKTWPLHTIATIIVLKTWPLHTIAKIIRFENVTSLYYCHNYSFWKRDLFILLPQLFVLKN